MRDSVELLAGMPLIAIVPALVNVYKQNGLPVRWAGWAAMVTSMALLAIADLALDGAPSQDQLPQVVAGWVIGGVVYGLAAAGFYSQVRQTDRRPPANS